MLRPLPTDPVAWRRLRLFIFDLDGTLIDSKRDLVNSVNATCKEFGFPSLPEKQIAGFIGQGAPALIRKALDHAQDDTLVQKAVEFFRAYYGEHMLDTTVTYPGVREALAALAADGDRRLTVLTNKPERFSRHILTGLGIARYFSLVYGGNTFERKKPDPIGVETTLREMNGERAQTLLIGDSEVDVLTARNAGIRVCGVTYGLGSHLLEDTSPDVWVDVLTELSDLVLGKGAEG